MPLKDMTLEDVLAPLTVRTFIDEYFEKKPLRMTGDPERLVGMFDRKAFDTASWKARFLHTAIARRRSQEIFSITAEQIEPRYAAGATICVTGGRRPVLRRER